MTKGDLLVHAEDTRFDGNPLGDFGSVALLDGARCFASVLYIGPQSDEELEAIANTIRGDFTGHQIGTSAFNGKLVIRILAATSYELRAQLIPVIDRLRGEKPLPRVWNL